MTRNEFIISLPEDQKAFMAAFFLAIEDIPSISFYHTRANKGDYRVKHNDTGRVLFTMYWQTRKAVYFCRCFADTNFLAIQEGLGRVKIEPDYEPLLSSFTYRPNYVNCISVLKNVIRKSVSHYEFCIQSERRQ